MKPWAPACSTCRFWESFDTPAPDDGNCRRHAPRVPGSKTKHYWPITDHDDWCGEYEIAAKKEQQA